jgi:hypothetical protein
MDAPFPFQARAESHFVDVYTILTVSANLVIEGSQSPNPLEHADATANRGSAHRDKAQRCTRAVVFVDGQSLRSV